MAVNSARAEPAVNAQRPTLNASSLLAITRMELRMGWRTTAFRVTAVGALLFGYVNGEAPGAGVGLSAYGTGEAAWKYLGLVAIVWMSMAAVRETALRTEVLVSSKPQASERLSLTKFLGAYAQILAILAAMFVGAVLGRLLTGGSLMGIEAYGLQFVRAAGILFVASGASYTLALLFDSPVVGALIGLYWFLTLAGKAFLAKFYFPSYTQNLPAYITLAAGSLCLAFWLHRRRRRGSMPPAAWVRFGTPVLLALGVWMLWLTVRDGHDPQAISQPVMIQIADQDVDNGMRASGFLLPDQHGKLTGLSDFDGKILVIALWSPHDPDSVLMLDRLNEIEAAFGAQGVQPIAICLGEDTGAAATFAFGEHARYPVVEDWGTYNAPVKSEISPLANAYRATLLPKVVVTDRRRRVRGILFSSAAYDAGGVEALIRERLGAEPK